MVWEQLPIETSDDAVTDRLLAGLATRLPGWEPVEGAVEVALAEEMGREAALLAARLLQLVDTAVAGVGQTVFGLPVETAAAATMTATLTVTAAGAVIPAGLVVIGTTLDGDQAAFQLPVQTVAGGATHDVVLEAVVAGAAANGIPAGQDLVVATATATVISAAAATSSAGGRDAETLQAYLDRFTAWASILRPGGVTSTDLALLARSVAGVHRALGLDLYDPASPGVDVERTVTMFLIDTAGQPVSAGVRAAAAAVLEDAREVNFRILFADPTYTVVNASFQVVPEPGVSPLVAAANAEAAVRAWLSPAGWGSAAGPREWADVDVVSYLELAQVGGSAPGVAFMRNLLLNGGTVDVPLTQPVGLPAPGDITVTTP